MFSINCLFTHKLSKKQKLEILKLKDIHWKHGLNSQLSHFNKNYKKNDLNNLLYYKNKLIGYTGLRKMSVILNKKKINFLLFDTLIISKPYRNIGLSNVLMKFNNCVIKDHKTRSYLVCKNELLKFYKKHGWRNYQKKDMLKCNHKNQIVMVFN